MRPQPMPSRDNVGTGNRVTTYHDTTLGQDMKTGTYKWGKGTGNSQSDRNAEAYTQGMSPVYGPNGFEGYKPMAQVQKEVNQLGTGHVPGQSALRDAYVAKAMRENGNQPTGTNPQIELQMKQDMADGKLGPQHIENINAQGYTGHLGPQGPHGSAGMRERAQNPFDNLDGAAPWVREKLTEVPPVRPGDELGGANMSSRGGDSMSVPRLNKNYAPDPFTNSAPPQPRQPIPDSYTDEDGTWNQQTGEEMEAPRPAQLPGTPIPAAPQPMTPAPAPDTGFDSNSTIPSNNTPQPAAPVSNNGESLPPPSPEVAADPHGGGSGFLQDPSRNRSLDHEGGGSGFLQNPERNAPIDDATRARVEEMQQKARDETFDQGMSKLDEYEADNTISYEDAMAEYNDENILGYGEDFSDLKDHYAEENRALEESMYEGIPPEEIPGVENSPEDVGFEPLPGFPPNSAGTEPESYEMDEFDEEEENRRMIEMERQQQQMGNYYS